MKIALKDFEHIRQIYRQSPFVLVHPLGIPVVLIILLGYLALRFAINGPTLIIMFIVMGGVFLHALREFIIWRLNQYVVTNQRLLIYSQKGLFDQTVVETPHERILNVSYHTQGMVSTIVGYGDVEVQVVGLMEPMVLKNITTPMEIKDYLWAMHMRLAEDKKGEVYGASDASHIQEQVGYTKKNQVSR
jgi:hypothetical protein